MNPKMPCCIPGCSEYRTPGGRYCDTHKARVMSQYDATRETAVARGYDTRWRKIRDMKLRINPLCECESCRVRHKFANMVHHIDGNQRNNKWENLMSMYKDCHERIHITQGDKF